MTRGAARRRLSKAIDRVERELQRVGISWEGPGPADITDKELKRAKEAIDRIRKMPGKISEALRKWTGKLGDRLFDYADKSSGWVAKKAKGLAWSAWKLSVGPLVILGGLYLLTQID